MPNQSERIRAGVEDMKRPIIGIGLLVLLILAALWLHRHGSSLMTGSAGPFFYTSPTVTTGGVPDWYVPPGPEEADERTQDCCERKRDCD